jgi:hypothetical protein
VRVLTHGIIGVCKDNEIVDIRSKTN